MYILGDRYDPEPRNRTKYYDETKAKGEYRDDFDEETVSKPYKDESPLVYNYNYFYNISIKDSTICY